MELERVTAGTANICVISKAPANIIVAITADKRITPVASVKLVVCRRHLS